jgi:hypothetical protein
MVLAIFLFTSVAPWVCLYPALLVGEGWVKEW